MGVLFVMESLRELYRIGRGPSSSHTMGPSHAATLFRRAFPQAERFQAVLYGSLAKTGKGHLTDVAIQDAFAPLPTEILWERETPEESLPHPNTMELLAFQGEEQLGRWRVFSVGGGKIEIEGQPSVAPQDVYPLSTFQEIKEYCQREGKFLWQYVEENEGPEIWDYLRDVWKQMKATVYAGLNTEGVLHGGLGVQRKAKYLVRQRHMDESPETRENRKVCAYAFAAGEQNAAGGTVVTAPTCGACGVLPAVLLYTQQTRGTSDSQVLRALAAGGLMGNIIKTNASISGAECGCQAEIGSACSMAAAALAEFYDMSLDQIEYSAEIAMEHHRGLTCDPIWGLVQIPCIERNAVAAMRALNAVRLANFLTNSRKISFDMVVETMYQTGLDMAHQYKETSEGGLAKLYPRPPVPGK